MKNAVHWWSNTAKTRLARRARASAFVAIGASLSPLAACSSGGADRVLNAEGLASPCADASAPSDAARPDASAPRESLCGTTVPPASEIVDGHGDVWTITAGAQIARNGVVDPVTQKVDELVYAGGVVYQSAYGAWWGWSNGSWQTASDPRTATVCSSGDAGAGGDAAPPPAPGGLTYMVGYGGSAQSAQRIATAEAALGRPFDIGSDAVTVDAYENPRYVSSNGHTIGRDLIFEMLSLSWDSNKGLQDMAAAASGAYDSVYTAMARSMAQSGSPIVSVRIGHEMNGNWYPWSATAGNTHNATTANYIATFKRIAKIVRQYNPGTLIEWCVSLQPSVPAWPGTSHTPLDYWVGAYDPVTNPGGADVISMDLYEGDLGTDFQTKIRGGQYGLDWLASFAAQNHVKLALSEVATGTSSSHGEGQGCPCSNDGAFMQDLIDWIDGLPAGSFTHFVFSPWAPADDLTASGNAAIQQVWKQRWGGTHFAGTWWSGPKVPTQTP